MAREGNQPKVCLLPTLRQPPRRQRRTDHVEPTLNDHRRNMLDLVAVAQDLAVFLEEGLVQEVMVFQPGKRPGIVYRSLAHRPVMLRRCQSILPLGPGSGKAGLDHDVAREQPTVIGRDQVAVLFFGDDIRETSPQVRPEGSGPAAIEPVQFALHRQKDAPQDKAANPIRIRLCIDKCQRGAPASTEERQLLDVERLSDPLDIRDEMPGRVRHHRRMRARPATPTLIKQDDPVVRRVEVAPHCRGRAAAGTAVQDHNRRPIRVAALLHVDLVPIANTHHPLIEWFDLRIKISACALLPCDPVHGVIIYGFAGTRYPESMMTDLNTIDPAEVAKFEAMAAEWWDPAGKFKPLHMMNPVRLDYISRQIAAEFGRDLSRPEPFAGLRLLDIGCGGGLLSEPMARLGATVVGADAAARNIPVARLHAEAQGLEIDYRHAPAEVLADTGEQFDVVLAMEIIEHVADPEGFMLTCKSLLKPGGLIVCSTLNRNAKSFLAAIVGAEWVMRWLPKGTHDWVKFITPDELNSLMSKAGLRPMDRKGFVLNPITMQWSISARDLSVNYVAAAVRS